MPDILDQLVLVFDTETTGLDTEKDRIVEVGAAYFRAGDLIGPGRTIRVNPGVPIPEEASDVHGIYDADVAECPPFSDIADRLIAHFQGSENEGHPPLLCGYNALRFDTPLVNAELARCDRDFRIDAGRVLDPIIFLQWHHRGWGRHTLSLMAERFGVPLLNAHAASADAKATGHILCAMVRDGLIPKDRDAALAAQHEFLKQLEGEHAEFGRLLYRHRESGVLHVGFGKHVGRPLEDVDPGYLDWCLKKMTDLPDAARAAFASRVPPVA